MTDNEIIKAFNEGIGLDDIKICIAPSFFGKDSEDKNEYITLATIRDVFNRQKAEIESKNNLIHRQSDVISEQKEKIERIYDEAVKEFVENFKKIAVCGKTSVFRFPYYQISMGAFDNLVKEKVGECNV